MKKLLFLIPFIAFLIPFTAQAACGSGYSFCQTLTVNHLKVPSTQTSFTVLATTTQAVLKTVANSGHVQNTTTSNGQTVPADLIYSSAADCSVPLSWEISRYVSTTGELNAWVLQSSLSSSVDTVYYMCYGKASVTTFQGGSVGSAWDSFNINRYHFEQNAGTTVVNDSTSNGNNGTATGNTSTLTTTGQVGSAFSFGFSGNVTLPNNITTGATGAMTTLTWVKGTNTSGMGLITLESGGSGLWRFEYVNDGFANPANSLTLLFRDGGGGGLVEVHAVSTAIADGNWHQVAATLDSSNNIVLYVDGALLTSGTTGRGSATTYSGALSTFGNNPTDSLPANDTLDEGQISSTARSANWIATEYNNQSNVATFLTIGAEQTGGNAISTLARVVIRGIKSLVLRGGVGGSLIIR